MKTRWICGLVFILLTAGTAGASGSVGTPLKIKGMVGQTVIFLPKGYDGPDAHYRHVRKDFGASAESYPASELSLKKAKITEYRQAEGSEFPVRFYLKMEIEGGGTAWYVDQGSGEYLKEMVLESHVKAAQKWVNKTVWVRNAGILTLFKSSPMAITDTGHSEDLLKVKNTEQLTLGHVDVTNSGMLPFLFAVSTSQGEKGYLAVGYDTEQDIKRRFYVSDPRKDKKWSPELWRLIEEGRVQLGMTEEQVIMAWGDPDWKKKDDKTLSVEWAYAEQRVFFEKGRLTSMAHVPSANNHGNEKRELPASHP